MNKEFIAIGQEETFVKVTINDGKISKVEYNIYFMKYEAIRKDISEYEFNQHALNCFNIMIKNNVEQFKKMLKAIEYFDLNLFDEGKKILEREKNRFIL